MVTYRQAKKCHDLKTSFFNTGIELCTFNEKNPNFFQECFVLEGFNDVTLLCILLGHCSHKYTVKSLQDIIKLSNNGITDWTNIEYRSLTDYLNVFTNLFSLLGFPSVSFSVGSLSKLKLDRKNDFKESHCIKILSKYFSRLNRLVETWLVVFLNSLLLKFMNSLSWFFRFAHLRKWQYMPITKSSTFTESSLTPFPALKCAKWQGKPMSKFFGHLTHFLFSEVGCYVVRS